MKKKRCERERSDETYSAAQLLLPHLAPMLSQFGLLTFFEGNRVIISITSFISSAISTSSPGVSAFLGVSAFSGVLLVAFAWLRVVAPLADHCAGCD